MAAPDPLWTSPSRSAANARPTRIVARFPRLRVGPLLPSGGRGGGGWGRGRGCGWRAVPAASGCLASAPPAIGATATVDARAPAPPVATVCAERAGATATAPKAASTTAIESARAASASASAWGITLPLPPRLRAACPPPARRLAMTCPFHPSLRACPASSAGAAVVGCDGSARRGEATPGSERARRREGLA